MEYSETEPNLYIHNSGLVILAPYFSRYFDMLGMLREGSFSSEGAAIRAVHLLEYLVSGRTDAKEHELTINKVLCGIPMATPLPPGIELTEHEIEGSGGFLNAVLQNWDKMSNSSVENLRGSFLIRDGKLQEQDDYWTLKVETKAFDIILSFLPWTFSLASLPWMSKRIEVDWRI